MATTKVVQLSPNQKVTLTYNAGAAPGYEVGQVFDPPIYNKTGGRFDPGDSSYSGGAYQGHPDAARNPENRAISVLTDDEYMRLNMAAAALLHENGARTAAQLADVGKHQGRAPAA